MGTDFPIRDIEPVFRPPSEAESLIIPLTDGDALMRPAWARGL